MTLDIVAALRRWCTDERGRLASNGITVECVESKGGIGSAWVDLESTRRIARATVWNNGLCDVEVLEFKTGAQLCYEHFEEVYEQRLRVLLADIAHRVAG